MIRAIMGEPGSYQGPLPTTLGPAPFYTVGDHPGNCADMDAGDECLVSFQVHAVGAVTEKTKLYAVAANNYSIDIAGAVQVTIAEPLTDCDAANLDAIYPVDYDDIAVLAGQWLSNSPPLIADIDGDGQTNFKDLARLAEYWLNTCQ